MSKTVWILNHYAQAPTGPGGTRHFSIAKYLSAFGWRAVIVAASVELNTGKQRLAAHEFYRIERHEGIDFLWVKVPRYFGNGFGRMVNMTAFTAMTLILPLQHLLPKPDVVIGSSVHPFAALAGALWARRRRIPFIFEVRDLWPQTLIDMGKLKSRSLATRLMRRLEKWLFRQAAKIIVLLPHAHRYIVPLGISPDRICWIPNGIDLSGYPVHAPPANDGFVLMYFGAHGKANHLENLVRAMHCINLESDRTKRKILLRLIGNGPEKSNLVHLARKLDLDNVVFENPVPKDQIPRLASQANAFIFNLIDAPVFKYGISSNKLFDFMAAARPIIFCCRASNNPIDEASAGVTVSPGDPTALARCILAMADQPESEMVRMGNAARAYVENNHSFEILARNFAHVLEESVSDNP